MITVEKTDYSISYPAEWQSGTGTKSQLAELAELFVHSIPEGPDDKFADNFNLTKQDLSGQPVDLKKYDSISEWQITTTLGPQAILESKDAGDHHSITFKGHYQGNDLKWKQLYFIKNEKAYLLTFTAEEKTFDKYSDIAESIFNSFKLK